MPLRPCRNMALCVDFIWPFAVCFVAIHGVGVAMILYRKWLSLEYRVDKAYRIESDKIPINPPSISLLLLFVFPSKKENALDYDCVLSLFGSVVGKSRCLLSLIQRL